jgi:hypothetical protein
MKALRSGIVCCVVPCTIWSSVFLSAYADDAVYSGSGSSVYPIESTDIRLVREIVTFDQRSSGSYSVSALLYFENQRDEMILERVGFPDAWGNTSADLLVFVDGVPAKEITTVSAEADSSPRGDVHLFEVGFSPRGTTTILHQYSLAVSASSYGVRWIPYVFRTGSLWMDEIEEARFVYRFDHPPLGLGLTLGDQLLVGANWRGWREWVAEPLDSSQVGFDYSFHYVPGPRPTFTIIFNDIEPTDDLALSYMFGGSGAVENLSEIPCKEPGFHCQSLLYRFMDSLQIERGLIDCYEPALLRKLIYARKGYRYSEPDLRAMFFESAILMPSSEPFVPSWISRREENIINKLKWMELDRNGVWEAVKRAKEVLQRGSGVPVSPY